jgi:hypothetical protein
MKKQLIVAASAFATLCAISVGARADDQSRPLTREEVVAQVMAARQSGELAVLNAGGTWSPPQAAAQPTTQLTRDQVAAIVLAARQSGELAVIEAGGTPASASSPPATVDREQVISEFMKTRQVSNALALEHSL